MKEFSRALLGPTGPLLVLLENVSEEYASILLQCIEDLGSGGDGICIVLETTGIPRILPGVGNRIQRIQLGPLNRSDQKRMVANIGDGRPGAQFLADVHKKTGGNPRFVEAMMGAVASDPTGANEDGAALEEFDPQFLAARQVLDGADPDTRELILALYACGVSLSLKQWAKVAGVKEGDEVHR